MNEQDNLIPFFQKIEDELSRAIISNDTDKIQACIATEWVLIGSNGILNRDTFLQLIQTGQLTHDTMHMDVKRVQIYDNMAIVSGREKNTGTWQGRSMQAQEWVTDVYKKEKDRWLCVLTHLSPAAAATTISEIALAFSNGHFDKVYPHLSEKVVWQVIEENDFHGKQEVITRCDQVSQYFASVHTDFQTHNIIAAKNKVVINGTAEFTRDGRRLSFISTCDVYEFNDRHQIEKITSYCIPKTI
jgi:ketosteroid isomerase-like protein